MHVVILIEQPSKSDFKKEIKKKYNVVVGHPLVKFVSNAGWIAKANRKVILFVDSEF